MVNSGKQKLPFYWVSFSHDGPLKPIHPYSHRQSLIRWICLSFSHLRIQCPPLDPTRRLEYVIEGLWPSFEINYWIPCPLANPLFISSILMFFRLKWIQIDWPDQFNCSFIRNFFPLKLSPFSLSLEWKLKRATNNQMPELRRAKLIES